MMASVVLLTNHVANAVSKIEIVIPAVVISVIVRAVPKVVVVKSVVETRA